MRFRLMGDTEFHEFDLSQSDVKTTLTKDDVPITFSLKSGNENAFLINIDGKQIKSHAVRVGDLVYVHIFGRHFVLEDFSDQDMTEIAGLGADNVTSPMPGSIIKIMVEEGQKVKTGQPLIILEAMKMENEVKAPADSVIESIKVSTGQQVGSGEVLIEFEKVE